MEELYYQLLGAKYHDLEKQTANVKKVIDLAIKAYDFTKKQELENFVFTMDELKKFIRLAFKSPKKDNLLFDFEEIMHSKSATHYIENFRKLLKDAMEQKT